ncbi:MAG: efflux RND transporter permease subunit [Tannerella sp.]|jgi:multidrug efflux pump subunit AcrB|nr:efflux RND transporter permease subunit [Tannerella sp.]
MKNKSHISSFTVIVAFVAVSLVGLAVIPSLTVKLSPTRALPSLTVRFNMNGSSARIVEMEVTSRLEAMLARISGVKNIRSTSANNYGSITLELDKHASMDMARFEASTIVRQTWPSLPGSISYPVIYVNLPDDNSARPFISYNIDAMVPPIVIQRYAEEHIKPVLAQIPDLYKIEVYGATPMEWLLEYDINRLDALGITVADLRNAIESHNRKEALGMALVENEHIGKRHMRLSLITGNGAKSKGFQARDIYLEDKEGRMICLDQLISVTYREEPPTNYYRINGLNSIYITLTATENANQLRLSKAVKDKIAEIKQALPKGYEMHINYDATEYISKELNKIYIRTFFTILILLLFVFFTMFNARYLLLIVLSLYFNISIAFILYYALGLEIQLYSLAGITISLSLIIDNTIIMADHYLRNRDRKVFLSILAATLTTVGALAMIFFLNEKIRLNLQDFAAVVMINLMVSLSVSFLLVPAVIENMKIKRKKIRLKIKRLRFNPKKAVLYFNKFYFSMIRCLLRLRPVTLILLVLAFGLPVFMIPEKINGESDFSKQYNKITGSAIFKEKVRPILEKSLGGTLRLFAQKVFDGSYFSHKGETRLTITASMPNGTTIGQMNRIIGQMESYLSQFKEIRQFQTSIQNPRQANIQVLFTEKAEKSGFPYQLKSNVVTKALQLGGGSWGVYGLQDQGFSNDVRELAGSMRIKLYGYNYDDLYIYADTLRERLLTRPRIKEVFINSLFSWYKDDYREYTFSLDHKRMASEDIPPYELYASISPVFGRDIYCGYVNGDEQIENIKMSSLQGRLYDLWSLANMSRTLNGKYYKTGELATIEKMQTPQNIVKENQQYVLCLQYEYIGSSQQGNSILKRELERFNEDLPIGYSAENEQGYYWWSEKDKKQYLFLGVIIFIIFIMTSILFNSLKQPLAIIFVIPVSYIGVFLTFYLFNLNFDQGGFASFVLLCGITVNASIYLVNEYNRILARKPRMNRMKAYIKSWNIKIVPIFLTIISTILGFIPFMVGLDKESFWFPLAAGTIGGLITSLLGIFIYLPLFLIKRKTVLKKRAPK